MTDTATMFGVRCTHGLKAGNCNTCPATRDAESNAWSFDAIGKGRTRVVAGRTYRCNRHGVIAMRDGNHDTGDARWNAFWYWKAPTPECEKEWKASVYDAFDHAGIRATCSRFPGYCQCPARF